MDETLDEHADRFGSTFERLTTPTRAFGFRITAMPKDGSLDIDAVMDRAPHLIKGLEKQDITITRYYDDNRSARLVGPGGHPQSAAAWVATSATRGAI